PSPTNEPICTAKAGPKPPRTPCRTVSAKTAPGAALNTMPSAKAAINVASTLALRQGHDGQAPASFGIDRAHRKNHVVLGLPHRHLPHLAHQRSVFPLRARRRAPNDLVCSGESSGGRPPCQRGYV